MHVVLTWNFIAGYLSGSSELKAPSAFNLVKAGCNSQVLWCQKCTCRIWSSDLAQASEASPQPRHGEVQPVQRARWVRTWQSSPRKSLLTDFCLLYNAICWCLAWRFFFQNDFLLWCLVDFLTENDRSSVLSDIARICTRRWMPASSFWRKSWQMASALATWNSLWGQDLEANSPGKITKLFCCCFLLLFFHFPCIRWSTMDQPLEVTVLWAIDHHDSKRHRLSAKVLDTQAGQTNKETFRWSEEMKFKFHDNKCSFDEQSGGRICWQGWTTWWPCCLRAAPPRRCQELSFTVL